MPRKVVPSTVEGPVPPPPPSPVVQRLRQDWRWAGISQFINTFSDAFGLSDWEIEVRRLFIGPFNPSGAYQ